MAELSSEARNLNWLVQNFAERVPGVNEAVVVSSDGLPIATSSGLDRDAADRFVRCSASDDLADRPENDGIARGDFSKQDSRIAGFVGHESV